MRRRCLRCSPGILLHWFAVSFPSKETSGPKRYKGQVLFPFPLICHPAYVRVISECRISHILSVNLGFFIASSLFCSAAVVDCSVTYLSDTSLTFFSLAAIKGEQHQHFHLAAGNQQWSVITTVFDLSPFQMHILWQFEHYFKTESFFYAKTSKAV